MKIISSTDNQTIRKIIKERENRFFWWEGYKFYHEIEKESKKSHILVIEQAFYKEKLGEKVNISFDELLIVSERVFKKLSCTKTPQGIGGMVEIPHWRLNELASLNGNIFFLAGLQDPGNVGSIIRIADAFSFSAVIYEKTGVSPYNEKAVRASTGSILRVPCMEGDAETLQRLYDLGFKIFFLTTSGRPSNNIKDIELSAKNVFVLGQEGGGINISFLNKINLYIPMKKGVDSLNVSVTAGIVGFLASQGGN